MIVAGVEIGNTTTEVLIAEVERGSVTTLIARRAWTVEAKGSDHSVRNAARLVLRAEQAMERDPSSCSCPRSSPSSRSRASLPSHSGGSPLLRRLDDPSAGTPAGLASRLAPMCLSVISKATLGGVVPLIVSPCPQDRL